VCISPCKCLEYHVHILSSDEYEKKGREEDASKVQETWGIWYASSLVRFMTWLDLTITYVKLKQSISFCFAACDKME
jgi:hypothetical protein